MSIRFLVTNELLFAYFAGHATALQKQMIERWVQEDPVHEEFFYMCLHEWETKYPQYEADTDKAIGTFKDKIERGSQLDTEAFTGTTYASTTNRKRWKLFYVAASVLFILQLGGWLFRDTLLYKSFDTGSGEIETVMLEDGSRVVLNANTVLKVPRFGFGTASRNVQLQGDAKFWVVHTRDNKRFVVTTDPSFQVEVLGTEFNLSTRAKGNKVVLQKGKVKVLYEDEAEGTATSLVMAPGDIVTVDKAQKRLNVKHVRNPENYSAWHHGLFTFDNTTILEVVDLIYDNYNIAIELKGRNIAHKTISGSIKVQDEKELLHAISEILDVSVVVGSNRVFLADQFEN